MSRTIHTPGLFAITLILGFAVFAAPAAADGIRPRFAEATFPDIASGINGTLDYRFQALARVGRLTVESTPFSLATGPDPHHDQFRVDPADDGGWTQTLIATLDAHGRLIDDESNQFELRGAIQINGRSFAGLLLKGKPVALSARSHDDLGMDQFDVELTITSGELARQFGPSVQLSFSAESLKSQSQAQAQTGAGSEANAFRIAFSEDFTAANVAANLKRLPPPPIPAPEPSALAVLTAAGIGFMIWRKKKGRRSFSS